MKSNLLLWLMMMMMMIITKIFGYDWIKWKHYLCILFNFFYSMEQKNNLIFSLLSIVDRSSIHPAKKKSVDEWNFIFFPFQIHCMLKNYYYYDYHFVFPFVDLFHFVFVSLSLSHSLSVDNQAKEKELGVNFIQKKDALWA